MKTEKLMRQRRQQAIEATRTCTQAAMEEDRKDRAMNSEGGHKKHSG